MKVLSEAAYGNATIVHPFLLLLLSNIPAVLQTDAFYLKFFENMQIGYKHILMIFNIIFQSRNFILACNKRQT